MKQVFADTLYWVAVLRPNGPHSEPARRARARLEEVRLVTTEEVLIECLGFVSGAGAAVRRIAAAAVQEILQSGDALVVPVA